MTHTSSLRAQVARAAGAIVVGYLCFALGLSGIVIVWFVRGWVGTGAIAITLLVASTGLLGALTGSVVRLAGRSSAVAAKVLAGIVVLVTVGNMILDVSTEPLWFKLIVLAVVAPTTLLVESWLRSQTERRALSH